MSEDTKELSERVSRLETEVRTLLEINLTIVKALTNVVFIPSTKGDSLKNILDPIGKLADFILEKQK